MKQHCNNTNCQKEFETEEMQHGKFYGSSAARVTDFSTCPHCGRMDTHWIYASDIMPEGLNKRQAQDWMSAN